jgi:hypothetical protein
MRHFPSRQDWGIREMIKGEGLRSKLSGIIMTIRTREFCDFRTDIWLLLLGLISNEPKLHLGIPNYKGLVDPESCFNPIAVLGKLKLEDEDFD